MTPAQLSRTVLQTVRCAAQRGELSLPIGGGPGLPESVVVEAPPRRGDGDYSVSVAFQLAKASGIAPYEVARILRAGLAEQDGIESVEVAGGGFLNVTLDDRARAALVDDLTQAARSRTGAGAHARTGPVLSTAAAATTGEEAVPADAPATDIARWSDVTGDARAALAVRTSRSSALFHVQYAHARTRALSRNARDLGFCGDPFAYGGDRHNPGDAHDHVDAHDHLDPDVHDHTHTHTHTHTHDDSHCADDAARGHHHGDHSLAGRPCSPYGSPSARALLALLADHRRVSEQADPGRHARHLVAVGDAFFEFHDRCPPLPCGDEKPGAAHRARMALVEATGAVLAGGLSQLGVTAPARI